MKIALITDTHKGARNYCDIFNSYFLDFFLNQFFPYLEDNYIDTIIHLGDLGDNKKHCSNVILESWNKNIYSRLKDYSCYFIVGNHDAFYKSNNDINLHTALELDKRYGINIISSKPLTVQFDSLTIDFIPWLASSIKQNIIEYISNSTSDILISHLEIKDAYISKFERCMKDSQLNDQLLSRYKKVLSGHFHIPSSINNIQYIGNPYEITWTDYNTPKGFSILDTETLEVKFIENKKKIFGKLNITNDLEYEDIDFDIYNKKHIQLIVPHNISKHYLDKLTATFEKLQIYSLDVINEELIIDHNKFNDAINNTLDKKNIIEHMNNYVANIFNDERLHINLDLNKVKSTFQSLYNDALKVKL